MINFLVSPNFIVKHINAAPAENLQTCLSRQCLEAKTKLIQLGYDPSIAERIVLYRPDIYHLIINPKIQVAPEGFLEAIPLDSPSSDMKKYWFASQVQDRGPVTLYRGMTVSGEAYDPSFFYNSEFLFGDRRVFTSDSLKYAQLYAMESGKSGMLMRFQIPRFLLYNSRTPGTVFFRDLGQILRSLFLVQIILVLLLELIYFKILSILVRGM